MKEVKIFYFRLPGGEFYEKELADLLNAAWEIVTAGGSGGLIYTNRTQSSFSEGFVILQREISQHEIDQ